MSKLSPRKKDQIENDLANAPDYSKGEREPANTEVHQNIDADLSLWNEAKEHIAELQKPTQSRFRTHYNLKFSGYAGERGELITMPSMTVPNQSMSIREILTRYSNGLPINSTQRVPIYEGDEDMAMPDIKRLDLAEIQELKENIAAEIKDFRNRKAKLEAKQQYEADLRRAEQIILQNKQKQEQREQQRQANEKEHTKQ